MHYFAFIDNACLAVRGYSKFSIITGIIHYRQDSPIDNSPYCFGISRRIIHKAGGFMYLYGEKRVVGMYV